MGVEGTPLTESMSVPLHVAVEGINTMHPFLISRTSPVNLLAGDLMGKIWGKIAMQYNCKNPLFVYEWQELSGEEVDQLVESVNMCLPADLELNHPPLNGSALLTLLMHFCLEPLKRLEPLKLPENSVLLQYVDDLL